MADEALSGAARDDGTVGWENAGAERKRERETERESELKRERNR